ncbi:MAG: hypothetical protein H6605_05320 [Flavobacteriales bacterium]|nr:hypothetical protein [Flavobacteriales bacterium]
MVGRNYQAASTEKYRHGFNGKENDNETLTQDYGMRVYDPRLERFLSVDPLFKKFPNLSSYQFGTNNPIENIDLDGLEGVSTSFMATIGVNITLQKQPKFSIIGGAGIAAKYNFSSGELGTKGNLSFQNGTMNFKYHVTAYASLGVGNTLGFKAYATTPTSNLLNTSTKFDFKPNVGVGNTTGNFITDGYLGVGAKFDGGNMNKSLSGFSTNLTFATGPLTKVTPNLNSNNYTFKTLEIALGGSENSDGGSSFSLNIANASTIKTPIGSQLHQSTQQWGEKTESTFSIDYNKISIDGSTFKTIEGHLGGSKAAYGMGFSKEKGGKGFGFGSLGAPLKR